MGVIERLGGYVARRFDDEGAPGRWPGCVAVAVGTAILLLAMCETAGWIDLI